MPQPFVAQIKEGLVLLDRTSAVAAELIAMKRRLRKADGVSEISRVQIAVAEVFVNFPVPLIGAAARGHVDDAARFESVLGIERRIDHAELGDGADGRLERDLIPAAEIVQVDSIHHEVDRLLAATRGIESAKALAPQRSGQIGVLRRRHRTRYQES